MEAYTEVLKSRKAKSLGETKEYIDYNLPVHLYIITEEDGTLPSTSTVPYESAEQMVDIFKTSLQSVSKEFHDNIDFYLCKVTILADSVANVN